MSANNYIRIRKMPLKELPYEVTERDFDTGDELAMIGGASDAEMALEMATAYEAKEEIEYGIQYINNLSGQIPLEGVEGGELTKGLSTGAML